MAGPDGRPRSNGPDQPLGQAHGAAGVPAVAIRADLISVGLGDGRPSHQNLYLAANARLVERVQRCLHCRHGRGPERRHRHNLGAFFLDGHDKLLRRDIDAQVKHLKPAALKQGGDEVLADVVEIAFHRSYD